MELDLGKRPHSYSSWWFGLETLGLTREDNAWFGTVIVLAFALAAAQVMRPRERGELWWMLGTAGAMPMLLAVCRANNDLVIFALLAAVVPCMLHPSRLVRFTAPFLLVIAAGLKYYPVVAGLVLLAEPVPRDRRFRLLLFGLLLALAMLSVLEDLRDLRETQPHVWGYLAFGAASWPMLLGLPEASSLRLALVIGLALGIAGWWARGRGDGLRRMAGDARWLHFILGASLLAGCFWAGMSWAYRWVFSLWVAPFLWRPTTMAYMPGPMVQLWRVARVAYWPALWLGPMWFLLAVAGITIGHAPPLWANIIAGQSSLISGWVFCGTLTVMVGAFVWDGLRGLWATTNKV
jgi:hypothetical protein